MELLVFDYPDDLSSKHTRTVLAVLVDASPAAASVCCSGRLPTFAVVCAPDDTPSNHHIRSLLILLLLVAVGGGGGAAAAAAATLMT